MYFESWLDNKKKQDVNLAKEEKWLTSIKDLSERELRQYLDLVTLSCILLASKVNEQNQNQPSINDLCRLVHNRFSYENFVDTERHLIQDCLDWTLNITTPYHFTDCIQGMGCLFKSDFEEVSKVLDDID